jgi:hypothetical protein
MVSMGKRTGSQSGDGEDVGIHAGCKKRRIWMKNEKKQTSHPRGIRTFLWMRCVGIASMHYRPN